MQTSRSQFTLFSQDVKDFSRKSKFGENCQHYVQPAFAFGFYFGKNNPGAEIYYFSSSYMSVMVRYKYKLNKFLSLGSELEVPFSWFYLKQKSGKILPDTVLNKKEWLKTTELRGNVFIRINFDRKRGNFLGNFADIGLKSGWVTALYDYTQNQINGLNIKVRKKGYDFYQPVLFYGFIRLGFNKTSLIFISRFSNFMKKSGGMPDLVNYSFGIEFGI